MRDVVRLGAVALCLGCASSTQPTTQPDSLTVSGPSGGSTISIEVGTHVKLNVSVKNAAGTPVVPSRPLDYRSRNPAVATVDTTGLISAVGVGATYIVVELPIDSRTLEDSISVAVGSTSGKDLDETWRRRWAYEREGAPLRGEIRGEEAISHGNVRTDDARYFEINESFDHPFDVVDSQLQTAIWI